MTDLRVRVMAGIGMLDTYGPKNWRKKLGAGIKARRFNLASTEHCVLGEVYGDFSEGIAALGHNFDASDFGFNKPDEAPDSEWKLLRAEWVKAYKAGQRSAK